MSAKGKLRILENGWLSAWCPGCQCGHTIDPVRWSFNGNYNAPTFSPSLLLRSGHFAPHYTAGHGCWCDWVRDHPEDADPRFRCTICHSFIVNGHWQFLSDCTHELAGQTVPMQDEDRDHEEATQQNE